MPLKTTLSFFLISFLASLCGFAATKPDTLKNEQALFVKASFGSTIMTFKDLNYVTDDIGIGSFLFNGYRALPSAGFSASVYYQMNRKWSCEGGLSFLSADSRIELPSLFNKNKIVDYKINGFAIPLSAYYNLTKRDRRVKFYALGGAHLLKAHIDRTYSVYEDGAYRSTKEKDKLFTAALSVGAGLNFRISKAVAFFYNASYGANVSGGFYSMGGLGLRVRVRSYAKQ